MFTRRLRRRPGRRSIPADPDRKLTLTRALGWRWHRAQPGAPPRLATHARPPPSGGGRMLHEACW